MSRGHSTCLLSALVAVCAVAAPAQTTPAPAKTPAAPRPPELIVQAGHSRRITALAFSPDGKLVATASDDNSIRIWDPRNGRLLRVMEGAASMLAFMPDGRSLVSVAGRWDTYAGRFAREFRNDKLVRANFALSADGKVQAVSDADGTLFLRNIDTGKTSTAIKAPNSYWPLRFTADGRHLIAYLPGSGLHLLDARSLTSRALLMPAFEGDGTSEYWDLAVTDDGRRAAYVAYDAKSKSRWIHFWDLRARRETHRVEFPGENGLFGMKFSPDGKWLAAFTNRSAIYFYDTRSTVPLFILSAGRPGSDGYRFKDLAFSPCRRRGPDGSCLASKPLLVTAGEDDSVRFWELPSGRQLYDELPQAAEVKSLDLSADRRWLATGDTRGEASVWDFAAGGRSAVLSGAEAQISSLSHLETVARVAIHPDSRRLAFLAYDQAIYFWDLLRGDEAQPPLDLSRFATQISITPDGGTLVINGTRSRILRKSLTNSAFQLQIFASDLLEPPEGQSESAMRERWFEHGFALTFSADGRRLAHGTDSPYVGVWDAQLWQKRREIKTGLPRTNTVALSPDARRLFVADWSEERMELWDLASDAAPRILSGDRGGIMDAKFSPDGKWVALAERNSVAVWNVDDGMLLRRFDGSTSYLNSVAFLPCAQPAPDGACTTPARYLFAAGEDAATYIWDVSSGDLLARLYSFANRSDWLVIAPDGLFDGTPGAWRQILWRFSDTPFDVAPVEMFFNEYYRPGLLSELMAGERPQAPRDIATVDRRVPRVALKFGETPPAQPVARREVTLRVLLEEAPPDARHGRGGGARDLRLFRNGVLVKHWLRVPLPASRTVALDVNVALLAGENHFTAYAFNRENVKSEDAALSVLGADALARPPVAYVLSVGVSRYANPEFNLTFAHSDAQRFASALEKEEKELGVFAGVRVIKLLNEQATKKNIMDALENLARTAQPEDSVFLFFSGHGSAAGPRFYFVPHDLGYQGFRDPMPIEGWEAIQRNSVSDLDLQRALERLDAGAIVLVIDACNSGQALEAPELDSTRPFDSAAERLRRQLFYRGPMNARGLGQLAYEKGIYVLTAAQSYQAAVEVKREGAGLLTFALIKEALEDRKAARVTGGQVLLTDWLAYPSLYVPRLQKEIMIEEQAKDDKSISFVDDAKLPPDQRALQRPRIFYRREAAAHAPIVAGVKRDP